MDITATYDDPPDEKANENEEVEGGFSFRKLWAFTGPGFLMSIAYLDPGNIESDLQAAVVGAHVVDGAGPGATAAVGPAGLHHRSGPGGGVPPRVPACPALRPLDHDGDCHHWQRHPRGYRLRIPIWAGVLITGADTFTFLFLENYGLRKLEAFFGALITTMAITFMYLYIKVAPSQVGIMKGLAIPWCEDCNKAEVEQLVGIVGAVIMPHNIYLHSALVQSREIDRRSKGAIKEANMYYAIESAIALLVSFVINLFVMSVFASAFSDRPDANDASLRKAGLWLNDKYGEVTKIIWGVGILAAGQSSTMTWKRVLLTRSIAMVPTIIVALIATKDLDAMNNWLNVLQSVQLPFALLPVLHFTSSSRIMGDFKNGMIVTIIVWCLALLVMVINFYLVILFVGTGDDWWVYLITALVLAAYCCFVAFIAIGQDNILKIKAFIAGRCGRDVSSIEMEIERRQEVSYSAGLTSLNEQTDLRYRQMVNES
ncbi:NRAM2-like protein [Mya arenaria]|uniref:NRAM2-like protein n=1 Tax=Mya arenaria TaxID=6604 RepID=A0ABY7G9A8_MYAAR|nr:NRAM2-like protein [Mya arenaria]